MAKETDGLLPYCNEKDQELELEHHDTFIFKPQSRTLASCYGVHAWSSLDGFDLDIHELVASYANKSQANLFRGPSGVFPNGMPWIVFMVKEKKTTKLIQRLLKSCFSMLWAWNNSLHSMCSISIITKAPLPRNIRWFGLAESSTCQAIKKNRKVICNVMTPSGTESGWFTASFGLLDDKVGSMSLTTPRDDAGLAFDLDKLLNLRPSLGSGDLSNAPDTFEDVSFWDTMHYEGPWAADLEPADNGQSVWGFVMARRWALLNSMAANLDTIKTNISYDELLANSDKLKSLLEKSELIAVLLKNILSPGKTDVPRAYKDMILILKDESSCYLMLSESNPTLSNNMPYELDNFIFLIWQTTFLDPKITLSGTHRPFLSWNTNGFRVINKLSIDLTQSKENLETLWSAFQSPLSLIDGYLHFNPEDCPISQEYLAEEVAGIRLDSSVEESNSEILSLLREAQLARQWSIPWGARVEIHMHPFQSVRIFEINGEFSCHFLDAKDRYFIVGIGLANETPTFNSEFIPTTDSTELNEHAVCAITLIAAAIVRDFLVVEERESIFNQKLISSRKCKQQVGSVIYLPRVKYTYKRAIVNNRSENCNLRPAQEVSHHLRRVGRASMGQLFLAKRYNVHVPEGFTFVRPHQRGTEEQVARINLYRSRSASRMLFEEFHTSPKGSRPLWFEFERDCAKLMEVRGLSVLHQAAQRNGDGGVDIYATNKDGDGWVVQCKCWGLHRKVGPDVVRELAGSIHSFKDAESLPKGILITTSHFTSGAIEEASKHGIELIDGALFNRLCNNNI